MPSVSNFTIDWHVPCMTPCPLKYKDDERKALYCQNVNVTRRKSVSIILFLFGCQLYCTFNCSLSTCKGKGRSHYIKSIDIHNRSLSLRENFPLLVRNMHYYYFDAAIQYTHTTCQCLLVQLHSFRRNERTEWIYWGEKPTSVHAASLAAPYTYLYPCAALSPFLCGTELLLLLLLLV